MSISGWARRTRIQGRFHRPPRITHQPGWLAGERDASRVVDSAVCETVEVGERPYGVTVVEGMDVVQLISEVPVGFNSDVEQSVPAATMTILNITITAK